MLRPLPPFRAEPLRKPLTPKAGARNGAETTTIKARPVPARVTRPSLKVLGRPASDDQA